MNYQKSLKNKTILVTGGTGSFGHTVVKNLLTYSVKKIIILSRDEEKQLHMRNKFNNPILQFVIGDVRNKNSFSKYLEGVDYVFHAAALKQVPTCEFFPLEAVATNIIGTNNVIEVSIEHKVKRVVVLSTDKAVYPINAMGMTKALMEKIMIASSRNISTKKSNKTVLCGVRYGNVLFSRGSVLPYFIDLIKGDKKLQVTNFHMTRFLLPLEEAVDLVFHAMLYGKNGDIYVRKAPSTTTETLAQAVCDMFHFKKGYEEVGIREGEKMHETLVSQEEMMRAEDQGKYFRIPIEATGLDYNKYLLHGNYSTRTQFLAYTSENTTKLNLKQTVALLKTIPELASELKKKNKE